MDFNSEDLYLAQAQRAAKQNFLREEILDNGFDPHEFTEFIESKRGANIDLWSFDELKDIVSQFKLHLKQQSEKRKKESKKPQEVREEEPSQPAPIQLPEPEKDSSHSSSPEIQIQGTDTLGECEITEHLDFETLTDPDYQEEESVPTRSDKPSTNYTKYDMIYQITALKAHTNELSRSENLEVKVLE